MSRHVTNARVATPDAVSLATRIGRLAPTLILAGLATAGIAIAGSGVALADGSTEVNYSHVLHNYDDVQVQYDNPFYQ